jgi:hypothetical protein
VSEFLRGFAPLKDGCIHLLCPKCGRKQSNMRREDNDPPGAFVAKIECDKHEGSTNVDYFDAFGKWIDWDPGDRA